MQTITLYRYSELSDEAKSYARDHYSWRPAEDYLDELRDDYLTTLQRLEEVLGIEASYEYDPYKRQFYHLQLRFVDEGLNYPFFDPEEWRGRLVLRVIRRYWPRYHRHILSNGQAAQLMYDDYLDDLCPTPLTGLYTDIEPCNVLKRYLRDYPKRQDVSLYQLAEEMVQALLDRWAEEMNNAEDEDYIDNWLEQSDYLFHQDGYLCERVRAND